MTSLLANGGVGVGGIYHERQVKELCALHALNNVFQGLFYTKEMLDKICVELAPNEFINPHKSVLGRGNYSINIIMRAVQMYGYEAVWYDKRRPISLVNVDKIKGFIVNVPSDYKLMGVLSLPWERKHWIAIARVDDAFFNLDSKLERPARIGSKDRLVDFLEDVIKSREKELFVVVEKKYELDGSWKQQ